MSSLGHLAAGLLSASTFAEQSYSHNSNPWQTAIFIASIVGAIGLILIMPSSRFNLAKLGAIVGAAALGGLWIYLSRQPEAVGLTHPAFLYQYGFSALAVISAVRVITHKKPVFSALWFVMVVLATAGLLLTLNAEFIAFALVIIYGGAILVTYVFVIMLAAQAGDPSVDDKTGKETGESYDTDAKDPILGTIAGFSLLALLLTILTIPGQTPVEAAKGPSDAELITTMLPNRPAQSLYTSEDSSVKLSETALAAARNSGVVNDQKLDNSEKVGIDLFTNHPLGLELAGIILLLSLVGAVVIARKRVETESNH